MKRLTLLAAGVVVLVSAIIFAIPDRTTYEQPDKSTPTESSPQTSLSPVAKTQPTQFLDGKPVDAEGRPVDANGEPSQPPDLPSKRSEETISAQVEHELQQQRTFIESLVDFGAELDEETNQALLSLTTDYVDGRADLLDKYFDQDLTPTEAQEHFADFQSAQDELFINAIGEDLYTSLIHHWGSQGLRTF
ncbi:MAG: hypothetical protein HN348_23585 [Proteobacteria bacterium]|nr:hypothetical protein [Pseudomonadota bacterium]